MSTLKVVENISMSPVGCGRGHAVSTVDADIGKSGVMRVCAEHEQTDPGYRGRRISDLRSGAEGP
jgi:hypothetical protein